MRERFTDRQREVARLIARGYTNAEIGEQLGVSASCAKGHADVLRQKLRVDKRRQIPQAYMAATGENPYFDAAEAVAA